MSKSQRLVSVVNNCFLCSESYFSSPQNLRKHLISIHKASLSGRPLGVKHRDSNEIAYVAQTKEHPNIEVHSGCPSCTYHSINVKDLKIHVENEHWKIKQDQTEGSQESKSKKICVEDISFPCKNIITFTATKKNLYTPNKPKLSEETIEQLNALVTISAAYNRNMLDTSKAKLEDNEVKQASLESLKSFPNAFDMLTGAIDQPIDNLAVFLWTYTVQTSTEEDQMINIIRYVLTDFCGKCNRPEEFHSKSERTFWIDRVIPIFQTIGDQTGLLGFEWCETNPISFTESTINKDTWKSGPLRNVDGLGYNKTKTDIIVMEASSGQNNEDMVHTKDDTLKNIHGSICALESSLRRYQYARCTTATDLLVFSVQSVCTRITLSTTSMDPNNPGRYLHEECRSAEIPMRYSERLKWLKVFELVSKLVILLRKQTLVVNQLEKENSGIISVDMVDTVWHIMNTNISEEVLTKN